MQNLRRGTKSAKQSESLEGENNLGFVVPVSVAPTGGPAIQAGRLFSVKADGSLLQVGVSLNG